MLDEDQTNLELELIESSLLPAERLNRDGTDISITSDDSNLTVCINLLSSYPTKDGIKIEIKGEYVGRDEAQGWRDWVDERLREDWDEHDEYPLYQFLTTHILPLLAKPVASDSPAPTAAADTTPLSTDDQPHHVLLTSHHLIAPSKRKDLIALSSQLSLIGFAKVGHPGIIYATGAREDLVEWVREVKSWQWLALRVRVTPEPIKQEEIGGKGKESGARGGKGRGEWVELEKVGEAVDWMRARGRDRLLTDLGIGVGA